MRRDLLRLATEYRRAARELRCPSERQDAASAASRCQEMADELQVAAREREAVQFVPDDGSRSLLEDACGCTFTRRRKAARL